MTPSELAQVRAVAVEVVRGALEAMLLHHQGGHSPSGAAIRAGLAHLAPLQPAAPEAACPDAPCDIDPDKLAWWREKAGTVPPPAATVEPPAPDGVDPVASWIRDTFNVRYSLPDQLHAQQVAEVAIHGDRIYTNSGDLVRALVDAAKPLSALIAAHRAREAQLRAKALVYRQNAARWGDASASAQACAKELAALIESEKGRDHAG